MQSYYHRHIRTDSEDFDKMIRLHSELYGKGIHDWTVGRLYAWRYGLWTPEARNPEIFSRSAELFFDEKDELKGFIVFEECGGDTAAVFAQDIAEVYYEIFDFLEAGGNFRKNSRIYCSEKNTALIRYFSELGSYIKEIQDTTYEYRSRDIVLPEINLPKGYILTDQSRFTDEEKVEYLRFRAFNPKAAYDRETEWSYVYARQNPFIRKELCIVLLNENKEPVSSCIGYLDTQNSDMEVEVVCTRKDCEKRGFAKLVIADCMRKAIEMNTESISISGWNDLTRHLYSGFGTCQPVQKICIRHC